MRSSAPDSTAPPAPASSPGHAPQRRPFRWVRAIGALGILTAIFGIVGFLVLPSIIQSKAAEILSQQLKRQVTIGGVTLNPYTLELRVTDVTISNRPEGIVEKNIADTGSSRPLVSIGALAVDAEWASLGRRGIVIRSLTVERPAVSLVRLADGRLDIADILDRIAATPPSPGPPPRFSINNIRLLDGRIDVDDRMEGAQHALTDLELGIPFISSFPADVEIEVEPRLKARLNGDPIALDAETTPFAADLETTLKVRFEDFHFARYLDYVPLDLAFKVPRGALTVAIDIVFRKGAAGASHTLALRGAVTMRDLALTDRGNVELVAFRELGVALRELDLTEMRASIDEVRLVEPVIDVRRAADGVINLSTLVPGSSPKAGSGPEPTARASASVGTSGGRGFALRIERIALERGAIHWADAMPGKPFKATVSPVEIEINGLNLPGGESAQLRVTAKTDFGTTITHSGEFTLAPIAGKGEIALNAVPVQALAPYYEALLPVGVGGGSLDLALQYALQRADSGIGVRLTDTRLDARDLRLVDPADRSERLILPRLSARASMIDPLARSIVIESVTQSGGRVLVRRNRQGTINWAEPVVAAGSARSDAGGDRRSIAARPDAGPTWSWALKRLEVDGFTARLEDAMPAPPLAVEIGPTTLRLANLDSKPGSVATIGLETTLQKTGSVGIRGQVTSTPLGGVLAIDLKRIPIVPFQSYFGQFLNVTIGSGTVSSQGNIGFAAAPGAPPVVGFSGDLVVTDIDAADKLTGERLVQWKSLLLSQLKLGTASRVIDIADIALTDFFARVVLSSKGRLNLQDLVVAAEPEKAQQSPSAPPRTEGAPPSATAPDIRFSKVTLQNGNLNYTDQFVRPNYNANLTDFTGAITEMTAEKSGDVLIRARVDRSAPVEIAGQLNPLSKDLFLDIRADARDIDLPSLTPYAAKYAGYGIEKGKLSFKVAYRVAERRLDADNSIILDQLTFGDRIESPTATKLPVLLAVALLKDRNGVIDINLPISGSLEDPQFSVGGIIWRALLNLITRAVTAPFSLIAAAFGRQDEELSYIEFEPGEDRLVASAEARLQTLAKALADRPALKLDVSGRADPATDVAAIREGRLQAALRGLKATELTKAGSPPASIEAVRIAPEEYPRYLDALLRAATFAKPAKATDLPAAEKERLLRENILVTEDDLRLLANRRALAAKGFLLGAEVAGERVFIVAPRITAADPNDKGRPASVAFSLK